MSRIKFNRTYKRQGNTMTETFSGSKENKRRKKTITGSLTTDYANKKITGGATVTKTKKKTGKTKTKKLSAMQVIRRGY